MSVSIFIWGFIQSFIVGLVIPLVKSARNNFVLSLIFLATACNILFQYLLRYQDLRNSSPKFLVVPDMLDLVLPLLVLIYINNIMGKPYTKNKYYYLIVPVGWSLVLLGYVLFNPNFSFEYYIGSGFHKFSLGVIFVWKLFLFIQGYRLFKFKDLSLKQKQQAILVWPRVLIIFLGLLTYIAMTIFIFWMVFGGPDRTPIPKTVQLIVEINYLILTCSIIFITLFFTFKYPKILSGLPVIKNMEEKGFPEAETYEKELMELIEKKKIHLDTELNESKLAETMGIHSYILSKLLNDHIGKSFSVFINEKRIAEAKRLLGDPSYDNLTIFAIAVDCGFKSESVFYVNFKKGTGYTPTQYKKMIRAKSS